MEPHRRVLAISQGDDEHEACRASFGKEKASFLIGSLEEKPSLSDLCRTPTLGSNA